MEPLDPQLKGALITASGVLLASLGKLLHSYVQGLHTKIKALKASEQTRWEQKVDRLELSLSTVLSSVSTLEANLKEFRGLGAQVDKLSKDIQGFHIWKRIKFPEDGGSRNGDASAHVPEST